MNGVKPEGTEATRNSLADASTITNPLGKPEFFTQQTDVQATVPDLALPKPAQPTVRKMLSRDLLANYYSLNGLQQLTGEPSSSLNVVIPRDLLGNSVDICNELYQAKKIVGVKVELCVEKTPTGKVKVTVKDCGSGWDADSIAKITDLAHFYSSRSLYKYPTIGLVGHFWKLMPGAVDALGKACHATYDEKPIAIISKGKRYDFYVDYDGREPHLHMELPKTIPRAEQGGWSSIVSVTLPAYTAEWLTDKPYKELLDQFALFLPHVHLYYKGFKETKEYPATGRVRLDFRESVFDLNEEDWVERTIAEGHMPAKEFLQALRDCSTCKAYEGFPENFDCFSYEERKSLRSKTLDWLCSQGKTATATVLTPLALGRENMMRRISLVYPSFPLDESNSKYKVRRGIGWQKGNPQGIPFLVEVAVAVTVKNQRSVNFAINYGPKSSLGCLNYVYSSIVKGKDLHNILGVLEENGIKQDDGVSVSIHLLCPNVPYMDTGKTRIDVAPFASEIARAVYDASHFYKTLKKKLQQIRDDKVGDFNIGNGSATQKEKTFSLMEDAVDFSSTHGEFEFPVRNLWYVLRKMFQDKGWRDLVPDYSPYFTPKLTEMYKREHPNGAEILKHMQKDVSGEFQEPRREAYLPVSTETVDSYQMPPWRFNKVLVIEKSGFNVVMTSNRFHDKLDCSVLSGQGEGSYDARKLLKKVQARAKETGQSIKVFSIHDADIYGLGIAVTFKHGSENDNNSNLEIVDLGLTIKEAERLGIEPELVPWAKNKDGKYRKIPAKINKHMNKEVWDMISQVDENGNRGWILDRDGNRLMKRVELNALTSKQFLDWLTAKLAEYGAREKVRPPDSVVKEETEKAVEEALADNIKRQVWNLLGGEDKLVETVKVKLKDRWKGTESDPDALDVSAEMDKQLSALPVEGWDDVVKNEVAKLIQLSFQDETVKDVVKDLVTGALAEKF